MRKLFLPAVAIALLFTMGSCEKCKDCTATVTVTVEGMDPVTSSATAEYCGDALKAVDGETVTVDNGAAGKSETVYDCK